MEHLKLTQKEADTLKSVKEYLESKVSVLKHDNALFPNKVHPEILSRDFDAFALRRGEYEKRWLKYKNQIFGILNEEDWQPSIDKWIKRICPSDSVDEHHYMDMNALSVFAHNLLSLQYPSGNADLRMINAILKEQGYENGIETIRELLIEETNPETINALQHPIAAYELLDPYKRNLLKCLQKTDFSNELRDWMKFEKLSFDKAYEILTELSNAIYYRKDFEYSDKVQDELDEVLEELWNKKSG